VAAEAATAAGAVVTARVQPLEQQLYVPAAASKPQYHLSLVETVRCFAATASRRKRAAPVAAAVVDVAAMTAADAAAVAADVTNSLY
jgi:hypothetical protein